MSLQFSVSHTVWLPAPRPPSEDWVSTSTAVGNCLKTRKAHAGNITFLFLPYLLQSLNDFCISPIKNTGAGLRLGHSPLLQTPHLGGYFEPVSQFYHTSIFFALKSTQETLRFCWKADHITVFYLWLSLAILMKWQPVFRRYAHPHLSCACGFCSEQEQASTFNPPISGCDRSLLSYP